ncbi:MAG: RHS repeat-associated core domain-containing protein [Acidobacteriota bacterium]
MSQTTAYTGSPAIHAYLSVLAVIPASYAYDQDNRRYKKTVGSAVTHYVWEGSQVVAEHNGSTGAVLTDYVYSGSRMIAKVSSGSTQYFLSDRLSTRLVLDSNGNVIGRQGHLPFGEDFGENGTQEKHHFATHERDGETDKDYALNRQYSQSVGRFVQPDPHGPSMKNPLVLGSYGDPQSLNKYNYVRNDPINSIDPKGLDMCFGYHVFLITKSGAEILDVTYLGFIPVYCWSSGGGGGYNSGGGNPAHGPPPQAPKLKKSKTPEELVLQWKQIRDAILSNGDCAQKLAPYLQDLNRTVAQKKGATTWYINAYDPTVTMPNGQTEQQYFQSHDPAGAVTFTRTDNSLARTFLGPDFFSSNDALGQAELFMHELLHVVVDSTEGLEGTMGTNGKNVTQWLHDGCK